MSTDGVIAKFDEWAGDGKAEGMEHQHGDVVVQVLGQMNIVAGEKILDLGCGNGWATRLLAQSNAGVQAIGIDASARMIARADELHSLTIRARYDLGSFENLEFKDGEFTRVFSMEAIYYTPNLTKTLSEVLRVLKRGGCADIVVDYYKESPTTESWGMLMGLDMIYLSEVEWCAAFAQAGFTPTTTTRIRDSRGPGAESEFEASEWVPDWASQVARHEAGSLWIHATRP